MSPQFSDNLLLSNLHFSDDNLMWSVHSISDWLITATANPPCARSLLWWDPCPLYFLFTRQPHFPRHAWSICVHTKLVNSSFSVWIPFFCSKMAVLLLNFLARASKTVNTAGIHSLFIINSIQVVSEVVLCVSAPLAWVQTPLPSVKIYFLLRGGEAGSVHRLLHCILPFPAFVNFTLTEL